jgi:Glycine-rich domain
MRLELAGSIDRRMPLVVNLVNGVPFIPQQYIDMGYTDFDVMCIGAGGGMGGGIKTGNTGTQIRSFGGAGGGGGLHRARGLLSALPTSCPVVVGVGGAPGTEHVSDPALTSDGGDGGYSSFNGATCRASGGKGGQKVVSNSQTVTTGANGGQGGAGDRILSGGGANGGTAGTPTATGPGAPGTAAQDGTWNGIIGQGGGGGAGGVAKYGGFTLNAATAGGRGSFNTNDTSVYGPGGIPASDLLDSGANNVIPGGASGAKPTPLNDLPYIYGQSYGQLVVAQFGLVVVRLTAD